jgi:hypothetical protein
LTFGEQKFGPKRMVRRLKGGVVVYGDADFPAATRSTPATDTAGSTFTGPQAANPLLAAVDSNARKEACKSLESRQAVGTTSTASSGKPGRKTAGSLTKDESFGHESSGGQPRPSSRSGTNTSSGGDVSHTLRRRVLPAGGGPVAGTVRRVPQLTARTARRAGPPRDSHCR